MSTQRKLLLISNSTLNGGEYLGHCKEQIQDFLTKNIKRVLFIPYALHDRDGYAKMARNAFSTMGFEVDSIHNQASAVEAVRKAEAVFVGGGNTFRLLKTLYDENIVTEIRKRVMEDGMPYIGSSAGSNVATCSINTTNDMPIVYPPTFNALNLVPFNINAHYIDADPNSKHMGETRAKRINEYHEYETSPPVMGIREGCIIKVMGDKATLQGKNGGVLFVRGKKPEEIGIGDDLSFLL